MNAVPLYLKVRNNLLLFMVLTHFVYRVHWVNGLLSTCSFFYVAIFQIIILIVKWINNPTLVVCVRTLQMQ